MVTVGGIEVGGGRTALIAGPCALEEGSALRIAKKLKDIAKEQGIPLIFKCSWDKANRADMSGYRGLGKDYALELFERIRREVGVPILTDIHQPGEAREFADVADVLQVPSLLSRQTDLLLAAGKYGRAVNIKKGQFMSPLDMRGAIGKVESAGNRNIILTERGTCFGYGNLVVDMRSLVVMKEYGYPVAFDATHSVRWDGLPGSARRFIIPLARAAVAAGADCVYAEVHDEPDKALCDGKFMLDIKDLPLLIEGITKL
jgi:2-dehydro-3-deoxyphosphooctonate aldolase (KDO 8-P synthase)